MLASLRGGTPLSARLPVRKLDGAEVRELAILIRACCAIIPEAEGFVAMLELQVLHGLCDCTELRVLLETCLNFALLSFPFAIAFAALAFADRWARPRLQEGVHVCSDGCHFTQCFVKAPPFGV